MSALLMPTACRCPQRSMLSHFVTPPLSSTSATRTRTTRSRTSLVPASNSSFDNISASFDLSSSSSSFASRPYLVHSHSNGAVFAPNYTPVNNVRKPFKRFTTSPPPTRSSSSQEQQLQEQSVRQQLFSHQELFKSHGMALSSSLKKKPSKSIQFNRAFLDLAKRRLEEQHHTSHHFDYCKDKPVREAAVFMPLCVVKGVPSVLFTVRGNNMRNHRGECSFPGGKRDPEDPSCLATALREMHEEVSIRPEDVEVLGEYPAMPNKDCTMRVQPYVGFIRTPIDDVSQLAFNPDEVQKVFTVPIEELLNPQKRTMVRFRDSKYMYPVWQVEREDCTVWGLTAFILDGVLRRIAKEGPAGAVLCPEGSNLQRYRPPAPPVSPQPML